MAAENKYKIVRYGDRKWINVFLKAIRQGFFEQASFHGISGIAAITVNNPEEMPELLQFIAEQNAGVLHSVSTSKGGLSVSIVRIDSPMYDELQFHWNPQNQTPPLPDEERAKIISWFTAKLVQLDPERGLFTGTDIAEAAQNELALRSATIERFEQVQAKLAEDTAAFNKAIQDNYLAEKERLDALLVEERSKLQEEFSKKQEALDRRSSDLDERESGIDALDNTAARRQIRKDLLAELQRRSEKFALTSGTNRLRWPVHIVSLAIVGAGIAGAYYFGTKLPDPDKASGIAYGIALTKPLGLTFAAVGTAFFYLRWLNRWFEQHAQAEFKLKQFQLDIERASWLVETALDWGSKEDELPKELMEGLSRNLFSFDDEKIDPAKHPADELASALMGSAAKVRLNLGGNEVELDGKKLNKKS